MVMGKLRAIAHFNGIYRCADTPHALKNTRKLHAKAMLAQASMAHHSALQRQAVLLLGTPWAAARATEILRQQQPSEVGWHKKISR